MDDVIQLMMSWHLKKAQKQLYIKLIHSASDKRRSINSLNSSPRRAEMLSLLYLRYSLAAHNATFPNALNSFASLATMSSRFSPLLKAFSAESTRPLIVDLRVSLMTSFSRSSNQPNDCFPSNYSPLLKASSAE